MPRVPWFREIELYTSGSGGYHTCRIPALVTTTSGSLLAFCEGRRDGLDDFGRIDIVLRRSTDAGATWDEQRLVHAEGGETIGNPSPVVDAETGIVWLAFCRNSDRVFLTRSGDDGLTWSSPEEITTRGAKAPHWHWYATGPGHGIQLSTGRLLIPCDHRDGPRPQTPYSHSHALYSDDHGRSWRHGEALEHGSNECQAVETRDGRVYMTSRNPVAGGRTEAWSSDGGHTWSDLAVRRDLPDPVCQASIVRFTDAGASGRNRILFSNAAGTSRDNMTVRLSYDECRTWEVSRSLYPGPSAYSDLAIAEDMTICCLYERGVESYSESIRLARFNLEWLTDGADSLG